MKGWDNFSCSAQSFSVEMILFSQNTNGGFLCIDNYDYN